MGHQASIAGFLKVAHETLLAQRVFLTFHSPSALAPDRVRSFLQYLRDLPQPQFSGFPTNLYRASEAFAKNLQSIPFLLSLSDQTAREVSLAKTNSQSGFLALDLGCPIGLFDLLTSPVLVGMLGAGARMLSADFAMASIEPQPNAAVQLRIEEGRVASAVPPIALWLNSKYSSQAVSGMSQIHEDWDGARLLLWEKPAGDTSLRNAVTQLLQSPDADERTVAVMLSTALKSPDWKMRTWAMLITVRRRSSSLALTVKQMEVPSTSTPGVTNELRHQLLAMQKASLLILSGATIPGIAAEAPDTRPGMQAHLLRAIAGEPLAFDDDFSRLIDSLLWSES